MQLPWPAKAVGNSLCLQVLIKMRGWGGGGERDKGGRGKISNTV